MALGGHLVSINSQAEQDFINRTFLSDGGRRRILWSGLNDAASEGDFVWSNGDPVTYTNLSPGEPNGFTGENYIAMNWGFGNYRTNDLNDRGKWVDTRDDNYGNLLQGVIELNALPAGYFVVHDGVNQVSIAAGAIKDVQGTSVQAYNGSFVLDQTCARVIDSSLQPDAQLPAGNLAWTVKFSEPMNTGTYLWNQIHAVGLFRGNNVGPSNFNWDSTGTVLTHRLRQPAGRPLHAQPGCEPWRLRGPAWSGTRRRDVGERRVAVADPWRSLGERSGGRQLLGHGRHGRRDTNASRAAGPRAASSVA